MFCVSGKRVRLPLDPVIMANSAWHLLALSTVITAMRGEL